MEEFIAEKLKKNITTLRKNRENVPQEDQAGKYRVAFANLERKITQILQEYGRELLALGFLEFGPDFDSEKKKAMVAGAQRIINGAEAAGVFRSMRAAVLRDFDLQKAELIEVQYITQPILYEVYAPYWLQHCRPVGDTYENDLIGMRWDKAANVWRSGNSFTIHLPPTAEAIEQRYRQEQAGGLAALRNWRK